MLNWPTKDYWSRNYEIESARREFEIDCISSSNNPSSNSLIFCKIIDDQILKNLLRIKGSIIITKLEFYELLSEVVKFNGVIISEDPRYRFAEILEHFWTPQSLRGCYTWNDQFQVYVGENVSIHPSSYIEPNVLIGSDSIINEGVSVFSGAKIGPKVHIGANTIIRENAVIGGWGFGIAQKKDSRSIRLPHIGGVQIGQNVEIGALTTICSGTIDPTVIGDDVKIDDHVHIAHNCILQERVVVTANAEISGSVRVGKNAWVAPNVSIINGIAIGCNVTLGIGTTVLKDVEDYSVVVGNPGRVIRTNKLGNEG